MTRTFNVGITGAGVIGQVHARTISGVPNAKVVAVAEPREDAGRDLAGQYDARWMASYEELLASPDIDIVTLATPSGMHPDQTVLAAKAGKHVVTEKPMAISIEGVDRMIAAAEEAGIHLAVIFQNRLSRDVFKVKRAIEAGLIGTPLIGNGSLFWHRTQDYYDANGGWRGTWSMDGGGALINQSIHTIDLVQWLMGGVESVQADHSTLAHEIEAEDAAGVALRFHSGAVGTITATTGANRDYPARVEIVGTEGRATLENNVATLWEGKAELTDDLLTDEDRRFVEGWEPGEAFTVAHQRQFGLIFEALANGTEPPHPGREARKAVDIIMSIYESARTGTRVAIP